MISECRCLAPWHNQDCAVYKANPPKVMTPEAFHAAMTELAANRDLEVSHAKMDGLMAEVLTSLGYGHGVEVFFDSERWYA